MGEPSVEELSNILIKAGARRTVKDLVRTFLILVDNMENQSFIINLIYRNHDSHRTIS